MANPFQQLRVDPESLKEVLLGIKSKYKTCGSQRTKLRGP